MPVRVLELAEGRGPGVAVALEAGTDRLLARKNRVAMSDEEVAACSILLVDDTPTVLYELDDRLATITLNRPDKMNSLSRAIRTQLRAALERAIGEARAIVLTGAGRGFCAGQDLGDASNFAALDLDRTLREEYEPLLALITESPV